MKGIWRFFIESVETEETPDFISFEKLGAGLQTVYDETNNKISRQFHKNLQKGRPNLIMTPQEEMHSSVLTIFNHDASKPLPDSTEVLLCTKDTVAEDVEPLCRRAFSDDKGKIFTVMYSEKLDVNTCLYIEDLFLRADISNREYQLVFFVSKESSNSSYLATALEKNRVQIPEKDNVKLKLYVQMHLSVANNRKYDPTNMRIILSHNAGMGKSLQVEQVSERLGFKLEKCQLHNKNVDITSLIERWKGNKIKDGKVVYGIDVTQAVEISERDDLIFSLAILTGVQDFKGGVWNVNDNNVYSFEVAIENDASNAFISTIPKTLCLTLSPSELNSTPTNF